MTHNGTPEPAQRHNGADRHSTPTGLLMGRPFGIAVRLSPSWLIIAAIITVLYQPVVERSLGLGALSYLVAFLFAVLLYASVLIHELAHALAARGYGLPVRGITLYMLGGVSHIDREPQTPGREFWVAFSGPLLSLVLAAVGFVGYRFVDPATVAGVLVWQLWVANLLVGVFNLLPGLPLDGGRLLRAAVWALTGNPTTGTVAAAWGGRALAVCVIALPLLLAWLSATRPDLFLVASGVVLGGFIWMGASSALRSARFWRRLPRLRARELAHRPITVPAETPLSEALRRSDEAGASAVVVTDTAGTATSIVNDAAAQAVPEQRRPWVPVSSVARAITSGSVVSAALEGADLLEALRHHPAPDYLLVDSEHVVGVLRAADVEAVFNRR
ncbi:site-2 protease family protein [Salinactinospora qingdaonensis]|uniref:Zinc metalloprotease n=1 Tax=Salinactinospora qingdaonensis TaxID=702744 RepID=A0ABP7F157_9ACTN